MDKFERKLTELLKGLDYEEKLSALKTMIESLEAELQEIRALEEEEEK